ncbi:D-alanyl-D-alanine carboxypeptidase/D-alanyl-D-alanine endopeptidase [Streptomyces thermolilacinus]|uniref:D-alanyl-D-alanine carboxypeptidase/D-alanyl-D-alanine-endopeptidase n=1 Tax=Streptomyces thermolilacinus SPC6 TaxID=1306406 RepID=A0A1D3DRV8_9ACTN|nr:D-alanyl-D-alanine carboxypeptidase/D-alanyl-D-alanine-endopeptidase [Streptomyces thermolilacinus]OEJ95062.1 D-alanyl-D-alanine carboxypeptidase/D-alanyl-D-alanine-endopeptidase [Streptomyces thermolilacinus SPC6]
MLEPNVLRLAAGSAVAGLALAATAAGLAGPWDGGQRTAERHRAAAPAETGGAHHGHGAVPGAPAVLPAAPAPAPSAPAVLTPLAAPLTAQGTPAPALAEALDPLLRAPGLGGPRTASVVDVASGRQLYGHGAAMPMTPASTVKIATTAAALSALGPDHRLATTVVATPDAKALTLVGGGDPTLDRARLKALAADTAKALRARSAAPTALTYDAGLYDGPVRHRIGVNDNIAPVTPLMTRAGRLDRSTHGPAPRAQDPARETARAFAELLAAQGVKLPTDPVPGRAPQQRLPLAVTHSAPLSDLVERTLTYSDNDLAEALARATARATGHPASFDGAGAAVRAQLRKLGVPLDGAALRDGSGLDRRARVSARLLTAVLARAADPAHPELRPVLTGLPVGGFSGTLENRYTGGSPAAGLVRAKTGTLTGVNALSGTVVTRDGRLLAFAFLASDTPSPYEAQPALDALATALTTR